MSSETKIGYPPEILLWGDSITEGKPGASYALRLERLLPEIRFRNHGKGGDTVQSLTRRLETVPAPGKPAQLAVLWVGVNDVYAGISQVYGLWKTAVGQPATRDREAFCDAFRLLLGLLEQHARQILVLPPLFVGEDPANELNLKLNEISACLHAVAISHPAAGFFNIREHLPLDEDNPAAFMPVNPWPKLADSVAGSMPGIEDEYFNRAAERRGLKWTYDGVHLNSRGADTAAAAVATAIRRILEDEI